MGLERQFTRTLEYEGALLGPAGARALIASELHESGDRVSYRTFRPELSAVVNVSLEVIGPATVTRPGGAIAALELVERVDVAPLETRLWVDRSGHILRSSIPSPWRAGC